MMNFSIETITPEQAKIYLQNNEDNRTARPWWINAISSAILRGEWVTTHQGIAFTKSGKLLDGQHRLQGIIQANKAVEMLVVKNVPESAFKVLDCGMKRHLADLTGMNKKTAEACRLMSTIVYTNRNGISSDQALEIYNSGFGEVHDELIKHCSSNVKIFTSAPIRCAISCLVLDGCDFNYIKNLYLNLASQNFNELPPIAQAFLKQAIQNRINANNRSDLLARALKAFNPEYANLQVLKVSDSEIESSYAYCKNVVKNLIKGI